MSVAVMVVLLLLLLPCLGSAVTVVLLTVVVAACVTNITITRITSPCPMMAVRPKLRTLHCKRRRRRPAKRGRGPSHVRRRACRVAPKSGNV